MGVCELLHPAAYDCLRQAAASKFLHMFGGGGGGAGCHVMELVGREAQLQWPYLLQMELVWDLVDIFCTCIFVPWVATQRQVRPAASLHAPVICTKHCEPHCLAAVASALRGWHPGTPAEVLVLPDLKRCLHCGTLMRLGRCLRCGTLTEPGAMSALYHPGKPGTMSALRHPGSLG